MMSNFSFLLGKGHPLMLSFCDTLFPSDFSTHYDLADINIHMCVVCIRKSFISDQFHSPGKAFLWL